MLSIMQKDKERCYICGRIGHMECHHVFGGIANRKLSEKYGLKVYLCPDCHRLEKIAAHRNKNTMDFLHREGQQAFESYYDMDFKAIFGKNYL